MTDSYLTGICPACDDSRVISNALGDVRNCHFCLVIPARSVSPAPEGARA